MRFFVFVLFSLMMFVGTSFAQNDFSSNEKEIISRVDNQWYMGSTQVQYDVVVNALKSDPESASEYSSVMAFYYPGLVFSYAGGFAIGYGVVALLMNDSEIGIYLTLGGAASLGIAFLLGYFSDNYLDSSIELYNKNIGNTSAFKVKLLPTEQGGLALAFAF